MINEKGILIKNVYYMLTYAFQVLRQSNYDEISSEEFDHIADLFAAILAKGISKQLKHGLYREYIADADNLSLVRGKVNIQGTLYNRLQRKQLLYCEFDQLSENNILNQILKTTTAVLLRETSVKTERKNSLKKVFLFFSNVDTIEPSAIQWNTLRYQRNNQNYKMLMNICFFVLHGLLLTTDKGHYKMAGFLSGHNMAQLFEKFVLEYYKKHYPQLKPSSSNVSWDIDAGSTNFLPVMKTDIILRQKNQNLIIDTKFYGKSMQFHSQYGSQTIHSGHLYQIFTYVKNMDIQKNGHVSGLLLYAKTENSISPDCEYIMSGNKIGVKTVDLNVPFSVISEQLNKIVNDYF